MPVVVAFVVVIELDAIQATRSRVARRPAPVERGVRGAVDVLEFVEVEPGRVGRREALLDGQTGPASRGVDVKIVDAAAQREVFGGLDVKSRPATRTRCSSGICASSAASSSCIAATMAIVIA